MFASVSVPIPGTISPNNLYDAYTSQDKTFPSPFRGLYLQIVHLRDAVDGRSDVSVSIPGTISPNTLFFSCRFQPVSFPSPFRGFSTVDGKKKWKLVSTGFVSVPIPGTISPNQKKMLRKKLKKFPSPFRGLYLQIYVLVGLGQTKNRFPSPFRGLYLQIMTQKMVRTSNCFRPHSGDYISKFVKLFASWWQT